MKLLSKSLPLTGLCLMLSPVLHATTTLIQYPEPIWVCVPEITSPYDLTQFTFDYTFVLPEEHLGQKGEIFAAFRLKSDPNKVYLREELKSGEYRWSLYDPNTTIVTSLFIAAKLEPIVALNIVNTPMDVSLFEGEGEILVGYGLKMYEGDSRDDIFKEMLASERYSSVRTIGRASDDAEICTKVIEVVKTFQVLGTAETE